MKTRIFLSAAAVLLLCVISFAQPKPGGMKPPSIEERLNRLNEMVCKPLALSEVQTEKVQEAYKEFFAKMNEVMKENRENGDRPPKEIVEPLLKERDGKIRKVLSEEKFEKYLELEKSMPPGPMPGGKRRG